MRNVCILCVFLLSICCEGQPVEDKIVLVNIDTLDRGSIAKEVAIINSLNPEVVSIDVRFSNQKVHSKDWLLFNALSTCKNLVMASQIGYYSGLEDNYEKFVESSQPEFLINAKTGFTNAIFKNDPFKTLEQFSTVEIVNGKIEYHFSIQTSLEYDSAKTMKFLQANPKIVSVDYNRGANKFKIFSASDVLNNKLSKKDIEGKIVLFGFLGPGDEDKFYTPMNTKSVPHEPDMYGAEILAIIVAQVLEY